MRATSSTMSDEERARLSDLIAGDSAQVVQQYTDADGLAFQLGANVPTARAE